MVSVILPSYNSETTIVKVIKALQTQTFSEPYEIILVDSSVDKTPELVRAHFPDITYIHLDKKTDPGTARNLGLKKSSGEIILFIDSDCIAQQDWIERMVKRHRESDYAAVGGGVLNGNDPKSDVAWAGYMAEFREFIPQRPAAEVDHIPTCNISYKRRYLEELGGFNPLYYPQEDLEFNFRLRRAGGKILFTPDACVRHHHRTTLPDFFRHQKNVGRITAMMLRILPLEGASIARSKILVLLAIVPMPLLKWWRTVKVFRRYRRDLLKEHPFALFVFAGGLVPWAAGFMKGVFAKGFEK